MLVHDTLDPEGFAECLSAVERSLDGDGKLRDRLHEAIGVLGGALRAQRVAIYGVSDPRDAAVRTRVSWSAKAGASSMEWILGVPLLTDRDQNIRLESSSPRGTHCPSDCAVQFADCPLRGECSSLIEPTRIKSEHYGNLAVHGVTGRRWTALEGLAVRQVAHLIGLEIAWHRQHLMQSDLAAGRSSVAMTALHQVATPVTVLNCVIEELSNRDGADDADGLLMTARNECQRLLRLCADLRALVAGAESGLTESCDVLRVVADSAQLSRREHPGSVVAVTVDGNIPHARIADRALQRMLGEVLDNAHRYSPEQANIDLTITVTSGRVRIRLRDQGDGIPEQQASLLGEPFTRLDPAMRSQPGGAGLGLAVVQRLAADAGGALQIVPRPDHPGTQVVIELPAVAPEST